jgi:glucuronate isomerase
MMTFINDNFLLETEAAQTLYHSFAKSEPILDYHCHLNPIDIAQNRQFANLYEIWLEGDHYKWRAMRACGVDEALCTGNADPYDKFIGWARTVPQLLRNPLYHWTHLELKRYFDIDLLLNEKNAPEIWKATEDILKQDTLRPWGIFERFHVNGICTTDDPAESIQHHRDIAATDLKTKVYPTFRPDRVLQTWNPEHWNRWVDQLAEQADTRIDSYEDLKAAIAIRHQAFHDLGCRLSDHGLETCFADYCGSIDIEKTFKMIRDGQTPSSVNQKYFASDLMLFFGELDTKKGWTKQLHIGALRNTNQRLFQEKGPDIGCDSIGDFPQAESLARYLSALDERNSLPQMILYNLNPADNYLFASMAANFQQGPRAGKIQFGSGWWHLDQKEGMQWQMNALSNLGILSKFIGMLTDSRSFLSYTRHEYFRRCLCNLLGHEIERGEIPTDYDLVGKLVSDICYKNAHDYLGLGVTS